MKMLVTVIGTITPPIKIDRKQHKASFTLKVDSDRFFVATVGLDHYEKMKELTEDGTEIKVLLLGYAFSYRSNKCGTHHVGIQPIILIPCEDYTELMDLQEIVKQWFLASLLNMGGKELNFPTQPK